MKREINLQESNRAEAFHMWMSSPMPMVTLVKTLDVSRLVKVSKKSGMKFTMLMCWCVGIHVIGLCEDTLVLSKLTGLESLGRFP